MNGSTRRKNMAEISGFWIAVPCFSVIVGLLSIFGPDLGHVMWRFSLWSFFCFAILSYVISSCYPRLRKFLSRYRRTTVQKPISNLYHQDLQDQAREKLQEEHTRKVRSENRNVPMEMNPALHCTVPMEAASYNNRILKPRQEAQLRRKEEDLWRTLAPAWKGQGHQLGRDNEEGDASPSKKGQRNAGSSREAAAARTLPEPEQKAEPEVDVESEAATNPLVLKPLVRKQVVNLPPEPPADSPGHMTVMLRTPQGRLHQRRFDNSSKVQVLLDFMSTVGYHQSLYTLVTSYPRRSLDGSTEKTLEEAQILGRVTLNVDRRDPDVQS